jgi:type IX secretion system PorP/SprF family membrane protein
MKNAVQIAILLFLSTGIARAQDVHFSQFYYSPFTLNPSLAGTIDGQYRIGGIYKNQWASVSSPFVYSTPSISGDIKLFSGGYTYNYLGVGLLLLNDRSGDGNLSNLTAMLSVAYHQALDKEGNYHLAVGLQGGIVQKKIDFAKLDFNDEFDGLGFNGVTSEHFDFYQIAYSDVSAGASFDGVVSNSTRVQFGVSAFHLTTPTESFFASTDNVLNMRYVVHGNATFGVKNKIYIFPFVQYQMQNNDNEFVIGSNFGYNLNENPRTAPTIFYVGVFSRVRYDVIPTIGIMMKGIQAGLAYDVNTSSDLNPATGGKGGFELALVYTGGVAPAKHYKRVYCPSF